MKAKELEWRNRQTHGTQNPAPFTGHESSTLSSSTKETTLTWEQELELAILTSGPRAGRKNIA